MVNFIKKNTVLHINPFFPNAPFVYPLKTSLMFSRGRERVHQERMG